MDVSTFVDEELFPPPDFEKSARIVVKRLGAHSRYYQLLQCAPPSPEARVQFLINYWRAQRAQGDILRQKIRQFYQLKPLNLHNIPDNDAYEENDFSHFHDFETIHDLNALNHTYVFNIRTTRFATISGKIEDLFLSDSGNELNLYCWARSTKWDNDYSDGTDRFQNLRATKFNRHLVLLNIQKYIMETYYEKKIKKMFVVNLHPEQYGYDVREAHVLPNIKELFEDDDKPMVKVKLEPIDNKSDKKNGIPLIQIEQETVDLTEVETDDVEITIDPKDTEHVECAVKVKEQPGSVKNEEVKSKDEPLDLRTMKTKRKSDDMDPMEKALRNVKNIPEVPSKRAKIELNKEK